MINTRSATGRENETDGLVELRIYSRIHAHACTHARTHAQPYRPCQSSSERHALTALATGSCHSRIVRENVAGRSGIANHGEKETAGDTAKAREGEGEGEGGERETERETRERRRKGKKGEKERERGERKRGTCMHTRGHCDGGDGWAVLRCGRWRKAIKRFCCGPPILFPSSALSSRLSTSPVPPSPFASPAPRRLRYAANAL